MAGNVLEGVRVGPLDPDATKDFGQVAGENTAKTLIRRHTAAFPAHLVAALSRKRHDARSEALDMDEVEDAIVDSIPEGKELDGFEVTGASVRGEERQQQVLAYTFRVASGRTGKGYIAYDRETVPNSYAQGDEAVAIAKAKREGRPWGVAAPVPVSGASELEATVRSLAAEVERLRAITESGDDGDDGSGEPGSGPAPDGVVEPEAPSAPAEPFEGYEKLTADQVLARVQENPSIARAVADYEASPAGGQRSTLTRRVETIADRVEGEAREQEQREAAQQG